jgi:hypothetical protein
VAGFLERFGVEVHRSVGGIGEALVDNLFDEVDNLRHVLCDTLRSREMVGTCEF